MPPKYQEIAADLRASVVSGQMQPGARLPGENDLMQRYGVARMTARQAVAALVAEGLVVARKGAGVFVRAFRPIVRNSVGRVATERWGAGQSIWSADTEDRALSVDQLTVEEVSPSDAVAMVLGVAEEPTVIRRSRRYVLDSKPVLLADSHLPASIARGTRIAEPDTGPGGIYARLRELGFPVTRFREDVRARMPSTQETKRLQLEPATPVLDVVRIACTEDGTAVEVNEMTADAAAYIFRYDFDAG